MTFAIIFIIKYSKQIVSIVLRKVHIANYRYFQNIFAGIVNTSIKLKKTIIRHNKNRFMNKCLKKQLWLDQKWNKKQRHVFKKFS